jgi:hypothetical protein
MDHNDLQNKQGGSGTTEFYHMDLADYNNRNTINPSNYQLSSNMTNYQQASLMSNYASISHSHTQYLSSQTNQSIGMYGINNTVGQSSSFTFDARSMSIYGAGIASVGMDSGSIIISVVKTSMDGGTV